MAVFLTFLLALVLVFFPTSLLAAILTQYKQRFAILPAADLFWQLVEHATFTHERLIALNWNQIMIDVLNACPQMIHSRILNHWIL